MVELRYTLLTLRDSVTLFFYAEVHIRKVTVILTDPAAVTSDLCLVFVILN